MGRRAKLKQVRRNIRDAFDKADSRTKALLIQKLEEQGGLTQPQVMRILQVKA